MEDIEKRTREIIYNKNDCHLASSISVLPIIKNIYKNFDFNNDVFILSKGHGCSALFAVLEKYGFKPDVGGRHPDIDIENGVSCTTGSLGHGLPIGVGMALAKKVKKEKGKIFVVIGDQEYFEGTTHESLRLKDVYSLNNLEVHVDNNENDIYNIKDDRIILHKSIKPYPHVYRMGKEEYEKTIK